MLAQVAEFLASEEALAEVQREDHVAKSELKIRGVPHFAISGGNHYRQVLKGAQTSDSLLDALQKATRVS